MNAIPQMMATGDLKHSPAAAFELAKAGPVVVMNRTTPAAVIVNPEQWNAIAQRLAFFERSALADERAASTDPNDYVTGEELDRMFAKMGAG